MGGEAKSYQLPTTAVLGPHLILAELPEGAPSDFRALLEHQGLYTSGRERRGRTGTAGP